MNLDFKVGIGCDVKMSTRGLRFHSAAIHYFDAVRRCGSIREAARQLNVVSSAVNRQILKLEDEVGAPLFNRVPSGMVLTHAGELFSRHISLVLRDTKRLQNELDALKGLYKGHVEIASVETLAINLLPEIIEKFQVKYPNVTVGVTILGSKDIPNEIIENRVDLGLAFALPKHNDLHQIAISHFKLGAIVSTDHPLASQKTVSFHQCLDYDVIMPKPNLSIYQQLAPLFAGAQHAIPNFKMQTSSLELMKQLILRNKGIGFQTFFGLENEIINNRLRYIPLNDNNGIYCDLGLYARKGHYLSTATDALSRLITDEILQRGEAGQ